MFKESNLKASTVQLNLYQICKYIFLDCSAFQLSGEQKVVGNSRSLKWPIAYYSRANPWRAKTRKFETTKSGLIGSTHEQKYLMDYKVGLYSIWYICSSKLTGFLELCFWYTVCFSEQMFTDKYPSMFSHQMEVIVYI